MPQATNRRAVLPLPLEAVPAMLVVDEAHYTKNPEADRTRAVRAWIAATPRALLLTSASFESKPADFCVLIGHLRPDLATRLAPIANVLGAEGLQQAAAPVYLRRTESDLVDDLPPLSALLTPRDGLPRPAQDAQPADAARASGLTLPSNRA